MSDFFFFPFTFIFIKILRNILTDGLGLISGVPGL